MLFIYFFNRNMQNSIFFLLIFIIIFTFSSSVYFITELIFSIQSTEDCLLGIIFAWSFYYKLYYFTIFACLTFIVVSESALFFFTLHHSFLNNYTYWLISSWTLLNFVLAQYLTRKRISIAILHQTAYDQNKIKILNLFHFCVLTLYIIFMNLTEDIMLYKI